MLSVARNSRKFVCGMRLMVRQGARGFPRDAGMEERKIMVCM